MPRYFIANDDDPMDMDLADGREYATLQDFVDAGDEETLRAVAPLAPGESVTVGGGAATQYTLTRIR